ncbi:hypothetical protein GGX14DRAFT_422713 [Mycena pura]|uniref:chitin deacetylase n=1 Tax=Mycena pura TaxID=153505 RepID=A0AAD6YQB1_9AGAR|nr:hypothetical protein GGX14DRAFT_422713 [Mycena pura]
MRTAVLAFAAGAIVVGAHNPLQARQGASTQTSFAFSLATTDSTAIPLASIVSNAPSQATQTLRTTFAPGTIPTGVSGAPPLPNAALLVPSNYPALDVVVPTDSPEVQQWIKDVATSGFAIPNITQTVAGGCPANLQAAADTTRCWWTCGGCVNSTDIVSCPDPLTWGSTFDDGPAPYTPNLLQFLEENNLRTTFFEVGSRVISRPLITQYQYMTNHQIAVHTWSHPSLTTLTNEQIIGELGWSKKIIKDVIGVTPTHFRPPFGVDRVRAIAAAMNLKTVIWTRISPEATFDTDDFDLASGVSTPSEVLQNWDHIKDNATVLKTGFILLEHDLFQQSVDIATGYIYPDALAHQPPFKIQTVIECMHKPLNDAYIETNDNSTNPVASGGAPALSPGASGSAQATGGGSGNSSSSNGKSAATCVAPPLALVFTFVLTMAFF